MGTLASATSFCIMYYIVLNRVKSKSEEGLMLGTEIKKTEMKICGNRERLS